MPEATITDTDTPCICKHLVCSFNYRVGRPIARIPNQDCEYHYGPKPLTWDHPDSDPLKDINDAIKRYGHGG